MHVFLKDPRSDKFIVEFVFSDGDSSRFHVVGRTPKVEVAAAFVSYLNGGACPDNEDWEQFNFEDE